MRRRARRLRIPFVVGNWKMNTGSLEAEELLASLKHLLKDVDGVDVAVCPPFPYLFLAFEALKGTRIRLGAQNMFEEEKGAFTGEVSPRMLKDAGCKFVILGHSERRQYFGETDTAVHRKILKALQYDLRPIVCVGETLEQREKGRTEKVIQKQLIGCMEGLSARQLEKITVAYEPVWAIGTGKTATPEQAQEMHRFIREWIERKFLSDTARKIRIQYGGSVNPENAKELMIQPDIDGALVGGASLNAESFTAIVQAARTEGGVEA